MAAGYVTIAEAIEWHDGIDPWWRFCVMWRFIGCEMLAEQDFN